MGRKCISLIAILCVAMSMCSGCASVKPSVELVIKVPLYQLDAVIDESVNDIYTVMDRASKAFAAQYDEADVTVRLVQYASDQRAKEIDDSLGTPSAPDVIWADPSNYCYEGHIMPLDDIVTDSIRSDIDDVYWDKCTFGGKVYTLPYISNQIVLCYNKDLFRACGLTRYITDEDVISCWTGEEWTEILDTLAQNLQDGVYPMMMYAASREGDQHIMALIRSQGGEFFDDSRHFDLEQEDNLEGLSWIQQGVEKGYFPPMAERLNMLDCYDLFMAGQLAIYCGSVALNPLYDEAGMSYGMVNFPSADGSGFCSSDIQGFMVFDNGDEQKIKTAKAFISYIYNSEYLDYSTGGIPCSSSVCSRYEDELKQVRKYIDNSNNSNYYSAGNPNWRAVREIFYKHMQTLLDGTRTPLEVAQALDSECNAAIDEGRDTMKLHP